ncbi:MAG: class I SAM-dependent methyltransferase [Terriglobales bacterium]
MPPEATNPAANVSPARIFDVLNGFQRTAALTTAIDLDVFSLIATGANTTASLAQRSQSSERGIRILCDALVVLELLEKDDGRYRLTPESSLFLNRQSPAYLGTAAEFIAGTVQRESFDRLGEAVRKGGSALADTPSMQPDSPVWVNFARNMAAMQRLPAQGLAELLLPRAVSPCKVLDIAAGHGLFGIGMALRNPNAEVYALDWPSVLEVAAENAEASGVGERWHRLAGNALERDLGSGYQWVLLPNFLHHFDRATCEGLLRRVRAALAPEGEVAVLDFIVDEGRTSPPQSALFSLIMLASTPAGDAYTFDELDEMFRDAGFSDTELHPLPPGFQRVLIAG